MATKKVLFGDTDGLTGIVAHGEFSSNDVATAPDGSLLVPPAWFYGDGSSGSAVISSDTIITGARMYENLTIADGVTVNLGSGYPLLVRGTLNMGAGSKIVRKPGEASGFTGGAGGTTFFYGVGSNGGNGRTSIAGAGSGGNALSDGVGGNGGKGGNAGAFTGGNPGVVTAPIAANGGLLFRGNVTALMAGLILPGNTSRFHGGAGGGGGAADDGVAGGGGGGGRVLVLFAHRIVVTSGTATISANGANGANAVSGNAGGGGGGGGGVCVVISSYDQPSGLVVEAAGGQGGTALGTGLAGANGVSGYASYLRRS